MKVVIRETNKIFYAELVSYEEHNGIFEKSCDFMGDIECGNFSDGKKITDDGMIICSQKEWDDFCSWYREETERYNKTGCFGDDNEQIEHVPDDEWEFIVSDTGYYCKQFSLQDEDGNTIETEYIVYGGDYDDSQLIELAAEWLVPQEDTDAYYNSDQKDCYKGADGKYYNIREVEL